MVHGGDAPIFGQDVTIISIIVHVTFSSKCTLVEPVKLIIIDGLTFCLDEMLYKKKREHHCEPVSLS